MTQSEQFESLCDILSARESSKQLSSDDLDAIVDLSLAHGVGTILLKRLAEKGQLDIMPAASRQKLTASKLRTAIENTQLYVELAAVLNSLNAANVPVVVLKGTHLAELVYANISLRPMDDIDLLVKEGDLNIVTQTLASLGYQQLDSDAQRMKSNDPHHLTPFRKHGCKPIEVHWKVPSLDAVWVEEAWGRTERVKIAGVPAMILSPEDLLLHLSVHASVHHRFGIGLRPLCDIQAVLERHRDAMDWAALSAAAQRCRVRNAVYLTLRVAQEMVGAAVMEEAMRILKPQRFEGTTLAWAREQIATRSKELFDPSAVSPRLANFWNASFNEQCTQILRAAFPPLAQIARARSASSHWAAAPIAYARHWKTLLTSRGAVVWRLLTRDKAVLAKADMCHNLLDDKN